MNQSISQKGFAALFLSVLILAIILALGMSITILTLGQQRIAANITVSSQAYYTAEAGLEDALLRLEKDMNWSIPYSFQVGEATATVTISNIIGGTRTLDSEGNSSERIRKTQVIYRIDTDQISFNFGAQVGESGLTMEPNSKVIGNVFSNGDISGAGSGEGGSIITETAKVAGIHTIRDILVIKNAHANTFQDCQVDGEAFYVVSITNCTVGTQTQISEPPAAVPLPISDSQINTWKTEAEAGGVITPPGPDFEHRISGTNSLGPIKIDGHLRIEANSTLILTGTVWVTGELRPQSNTNIYLDPSFGTLSGIFISDGTIRLESNILVCGSEGIQTSPRQCNSSNGSFIIFLSTSPSLDPDQPALRIDADTEAAIAYTSKGIIDIRSNSSLKEVTGFAVRLRSNAQIIYEIGLQDVSFISGPGGSWQVTSWKEIE